MVAVVEAVSQAAGCLRGLAVLWWHLWVLEVVIQGSQGLLTCCWQRRYLEQRELS